MNKQNEFWVGEGGDAYTARNRVDWRARIPFWARIMDKTGARSVFEVGCNAGWNLSAIQRACPSARLNGCEINMNAVLQAQAAGLNVSHKDALFALSRYQVVDTWIVTAELVATVGVLIHIPPDKLDGYMRLIATASSDYVLAVEYASLSGDEEPVEYRGQQGLLWRRDFGRLYQELGLKLIESGDAGPGFDRCTYWLLRR